MPGTVIDEAGAALGKWAGNRDRSNCSLDVSRLPASWRAADDPGKMTDDDWPHSRVSPGRALSEGRLLKLSAHL